MMIQSIFALVVFWVCVVSAFCVQSGYSEEPLFDKKPLYTETAVQNINQNLSTKKAMMDRSEDAGSQNLLQEKTAVEGERNDGDQKILKIDKTGDNVFKMELRNVEIKDFLRVLAHEYSLNIIFEKEIQGVVTASFSNITLEEALRGVLGNLNLIAVREGNLMKIKRNLVSKTYVLKHIEARVLYTTLSGEQRSEGKVAKKGALVDLLSQDGKIFLGRIPNSLLIIDYPVYLDKVDEYIETMDRKMESRIFKLKYLNAEDIVREPKEKK